MVLHCPLVRGPSDPPATRPRPTRNPPATYPATHPGTHPATRPRHARDPPRASVLTLIRNCG
eukprot:6038448-Pyramimonas_sp.AAC.1